MKEFMEEYGGVIAACITGLIFLGLLWYLLQPNPNSLFDLIVQFFRGFGTAQG